MGNSQENHSFLDFAYQLYRTMKTNEISLVYEGEVTQEITKTFTSLTEKSLAKSEESNAVQRKVFNVMVECLQNISKHADSLSDEDENERRGIVMVSRGDDCYNIITGNVIKNEKVPGLRENLEQVNSLDKKGLSELYKTQMRDGRISDKGGAGLGLIDIAKKTGSELTYQFKKISDEVSFFILTSTIRRNN
ncbi:SiaB family protein kinase [Plebeiibacterium sediminum]|uniref:SiaB family protein kinase n=1 Tax=Plebeiibacterium sediminum TaxID=2992112 RepID=A0AAE3M1Q2_9BACT|nr:SiaB family protein kinase [Plebeiobacterium sediminum]MCW3785125.1 SiaB family protein kinase [Plebeiobacterium sediminum]